MSKIAIIDDDASVRNSIEIVLNANGHATVSFPDPKNFLATADVREFDLLLVDNDMPHMTGLELREWLLGHYSEHPKFVLMSGKIVEEDFLATEKSGAITLLNKPFSLSKLLHIVSS
jgi:FixJ family two-component response regulator